MFNLELTITELQKYGTEMLHEVADICERNNLRWFMAYGSVLGAIRHNGPIPWDYDIDIYVPECDLNKFLLVMREELSDRYWIDYRQDEKTARAFPRIGLNGYETEILHIDVFRLGGLPATPIMLKLFTTYSRLLFVTWKSKTLDIDYYYPDTKRRIIAKCVRAITSFIPLRIVLKELDSQASRIHFDKAIKVASPITTVAPRVMLDRNLFDESILVDYESFKVRVPKDFEKYLKIEFGDWRKFPPKEEREKTMHRLYEVRATK